MVPKADEGVSKHKNNRSNMEIINRIKIMISEMAKSERDFSIKNWSKSKDA